MSAEPTLFKYRGRAISAQDASFIRDLIAHHPGASRYRLSVLLCEAWNWSIFQSINEPEMF
jgi:hypothetical protein